MMRRILLCVFALGAALLSISAPAASAQVPGGWSSVAAPGASAQVPGGWSSVAARFRERVEAEGVVGASLALVQDGRIAASELVGLADRETARAVDERTIYHWASITKTFTGIAIMQLRDRGLLSLDDPIVRYVPELAAIHDEFGPVEAITIRMLMSHSAGFRGPTWPWGGSEPWHPHEPTEWSQLVAMMPYTRVEFEPGTRWQYSNPGIVFLGRVIERLTGEPYEVYVEKNVLRPLGMHESYFDTTPYHLLSFRSNNYYARGDSLVANGLDFDTGITVSNGGLNAPLPDMARYLGFLAGDPARAGEYARVLARESLEEMWEDQVPIGEADGLGWTMGLCFFLLRDGRARFVGHTGGQKGFVSFIYVHPESGTGVIAAFNTLGVGSPPAPDTRGILAEVRGRLFTDVFPRWFDAR